MASRWRFLSVTSMLLAASVAAAPGDSPAPSARLEPSQSGSSAQDAERRDAWWSAYDEATEFREAGRDSDAQARVNALERSCAGDPGCLGIVALARWARGLRPGQRVATDPLLDKAVSAGLESNDGSYAARMLRGIGWALYMADEERQALERFEQALAVYRSLKDRSGEWRALYNIGLCWKALGEPPRAIRFLEDALEILRSEGERYWEPRALSSLGFAWEAQGDHARAVEFHQQARAAARAIPNPEDEADALEAMGKARLTLGQAADAVQAYSEAVAIRRKLGGAREEARLLDLLATAEEKGGELEAGAPSRLEAADAWLRAGDRKSAARDLDKAGNAYSSRHPSEAVKAYGRAAALWKELGEAAEEAGTLIPLSRRMAQGGDLEGARSTAERALALTRDGGQRTLEAEAHFWLGSLHVDAGRVDEAGAEYLSAISRWREAGEKAPLADGLIALSLVLSIREDNEAAERACAEALVLAREVHDPATEIAAHRCSARTGLEPLAVLAHLDQALALLEQDPSVESTLRGDRAHALMDLGRLREAMEELDRSMSAARAKGSPGNLADAHAAAARAWSILGDWQKTLASSKLELEFARTAGNRRRELSALVNIGDAYIELEELHEASQWLEEGLALARKMNFPFMEASAQLSLCNLHREEGAPERALQACEAAVEIYRRSKTRVGLSGALRELAKTLERMGQSQLAQARAEEAVAIFVGRPELRPLAGALVTTAEVVKASAPDRAILHLKQAVNIYQPLRADVTGLGRDAARSYTATVSKAYRLLADLLIDQGRLAEAQQVMDLLKDDELKRLLRRSGTGTGRIAFTPRERDLDASYAHLAKAIAALEAEAASLRRSAEGGMKDKERLASVEGQLVGKREAVRAWFAGVAAGLAQLERWREREGREFAGIRHALKKLGSDTVAVYTVAGEHRVRLLVYSAEGDEPAAEFPIEAKSLSSRVFKLRQALANPKEDPRPAAAALHDVLVGPIEATLTRLGAKTILWSLDGPLRYVPVAALWDHGSRRWLAERYRSGIITSASLTRLAEPPAKSWKALALGVSKVQPGAPGNEDLKDLACVPAELGAVVRQAQGSSGAMPGLALLDREFARGSLEAELKKRRPVVHLASHYVFRPAGDEEGSFLLLGDGSHLTLKELDSWRSGALDDVDLLTLSACETAASADARELEGAEVDGLAMVAQQKGAAAVLATLWPVADSATSAFMAEFYRRRQAGLTKVEAIRQVQLAMIGGTLNSATLPAVSKCDRTAGEHSRAPAPKSWTHPYYWAPFILLGNAL